MPEEQPVFPPSWFRTVLRFFILSLYICPIYFFIRNYVQQKKWVTFRIVRNVTRRKDLRYELGDFEILSALVFVARIRPPEHAEKLVFSDDLYFLSLGIIFLCQYPLIRFIAAYRVGAVTPDNEIIGIQGNEFLRNPSAGSDKRESLSPKVRRRKRTGCFLL